MNWKEYQQQTERTFPDKGYELNLLHCVIGTSTEVAELLDQAKKHIYYGKELDVVNIEEEIGDACWYLSNLCRLLNLDFDQILQKNIDKLYARFPDKFDAEKAINRDTEQERKILEK